MSIMDILKQPMVLMMVVPVFLMWTMTKLNANLSPEEKQEMQRSQAAFTAPKLPSMADALASMTSAPKADIKRRPD